MERNLTLYPWLHVGRSALFWLPVFVLYFSSLLAPADVLRLEALYYAGVVLLEVPSGYFSDRVGRRITLVIATLAWVAGAALLATSSEFWGLAAGQLLLATGMAFQSGTDSALLYDSLVVLDRDEEFASREARARSFGFASLAVSALLGGMLASLDLRLGHALTALVGLLAVAATVGMHEPPRTDSAASPLEQLRTVGAQLRKPVLRWTLAHAIGMTVAAHVPYELAQPWIEALLANLDAGVAMAPPVSGLVIFATMGLASLLGPWGPPLAKRIGVANTIMVAWGLTGLVLVSMALAIHPALLPFLCLRSAPSALSGPVLAALVHPELPSQVRATWLSLESLAGRLAFAGALTVAAAVLAEDTGWTPRAMQSLLWPAVVGSALWTMALWLTRPKRRVP